MSSVVSGSLLCRVTDPRPVSYLKHCFHSYFLTKLGKPLTQGTKSWLGQKGDLLSWVTLFR